MIKGADEVLDEVVRRRDKLLMLTMNIIMDHDTKWEKMKRVGISKWFDEGSVHMVRTKTPEKMLELTKGFRKDRSYMVGNSFRNDILPAIEAGIKAIYIPRPKVKRLIRRYPEYDNLIVLKDIRELIDIYDEL